jgi:hypothetical protein
VGCRAFEDLEVQSRGASALSIWLGSRDSGSTSIEHALPCKPFENSSTSVAALVVPSRCRSFAPRSRSSSVELLHSQIEPRGHSNYDVYHKLHPAFLASPVPRLFLMQMRSKPLRIRPTWLSRRGRLHLAQMRSTCTALSINRTTTPLWTTAHHATAQYLKE